MKRMKLLFTLAIPVMLLQSAQAQTGSRLIAKADWHNDGAIFQPTDTAVYMYSGTRGGDLKHAMKYDTARAWVYDPTATAFVGSTNMIQTFDANNNLVSRTNQTWNAITLTWNNVSKSLYFYTGSNLTTMVFQTWNGTNWQNISNDVYTYDPSNRLVQDKYGIFNSLTAAFDASNEINYFYDGTGNKIQQNTLAISGTTYTQVSQENYTYDAANKLTNDVYSQWNGIAYVASYQNAYTYDTTGNRLTAQYSTYNTSTSAWDNVTLKTYGGFTSSMPTVELDQVWDTTGGGTWDNSIQYTYTYNSSNQLTNSVGESWNVAGFWEFANGDPAANYYYESYSTTGINNVVANGTVSILPNPAQDMININLKWNEAQAFTISMFDMSGRVVMQTSVPATAQYSTSLSVNSLPAGNYIVKINGTNGNITQQVVVAH